jgi:hypothetical protein
MFVRSDTVYTFNNSMIAVYDNYTEGYGLFGYNSDPSAVQISGVSKAGSTITYTTMAALPQSYFPATYAATPTAGGSGYTTADVGVYAHTACGGSFYIRAVSGGAVTAVYGAGTALWGCSTGSGQATTGGHGSGLTVSVTAIPSPTVMIEANLLKNGQLTWDYTCNGVFTASIASATTFTVTNSACSSFSPTISPIGIGGFVSSLIPYGNYFFGGTEMSGHFNGVDDIKFYEWYTNSSIRQPWSTPYFGSKFSVYGATNTAGGVGPGFEYGGDANTVGCTNASDSDFCSLQLKSTNLIETSVPPTGYNDQDTCYADSVSHTIKCALNGSAFQQAISIFKGSLTLNAGSWVAGTAGSYSSGAIASAAYATYRVAVAGATSTTVCHGGFSGAFIGITGFVPSTSGMLAIGAYPTSGYCNFTVVNNTSGSITLPNTTLLNVVAF